MVSQFPQTEYIAKDNSSSISYKFRWHILIILSICLLLASMGATILHAVMPTIILDLKPSNLQQLWIINGICISIMSCFTWVRRISDDALHFIGIA
ncbi:multidrug resistance protein [Rickettsia montanensis]|uniref:Multidrug resistance protein n=1 Tax=Rickettsia montanensis (strain OSU 85-930) TaxID=1105114 RepID=H8KCX3_RICMS|nr:multidrug resistance protein [Rickettsia montanensis]AFC73506.1 multidrug resistance protein [Rickettsia montanensis str. OSU 85-930]